MSRRFPLDTALARAAAVGCAALGVLAACQGAPAPPPETTGPTPTPAASQPSSAPVASPAAPGVTPAAPLRSPAPPPPLASGVTPFAVAPGGAEAWAPEAGANLRLIVSGTHGSASGPGFRLSPGASAASAYKPGAPAPDAVTSLAPMRRVAQARARQLGDRESFWVNTGDSTNAGDVRRTAVLTRITPNGYFWVDTEARAPSLTEWLALTEAFESRIYPRVTGLLGAEARPGVDGEARLHIVISPAVHGLEANTDVLAYFWGRDATPGSTDPNSNRKEAIFLSDKLVGASPLLVQGSIAHELQHLINFTRKAPLLGYAAKEAVWLDEGLSMMAMDVAGYGLREGERLVATDVRAFLANPGAYSLTDWGSNPGGASFGTSYLFVRYLADRHGEAALRELLETQRVGIEAVDQVLRRRGDDIERFFRAWAIANLVSGTPEAENTPYQYAWFNPRGTYGNVQLPGIAPEPASGELAERLRPWSSRYYDYQGASGPLSLKDTGGTGLLGAWLRR